MENLRLTKNGKEYARMLDRSTTQFKLKNLRELEASYNQDLDRYCFMVVCLSLGQVCYSVELHSIGLVFSFMALVSFLRATFKVNDNLLWAERQIQQENASKKDCFSFSDLLMGIKNAGSQPIVACGPALKNGIYCLTESSSPSGLRF